MKAPRFTMPRLLAVVWLLTALSYGYCRSFGADAYPLEAIKYFFWLGVIACVLSFGYFVYRLL